jgi:hypothetical protein
MTFTMKKPLAEVEAKYKAIDLKSITGDEIKADLYGFFSCIRTEIFSEENKRCAKTITNTLLKLAKKFKDDDFIVYHCIDFARVMCCSTVSIQLYFRPVKFTKWVTSLYLNSDDRLEKLRLDCCRYFANVSNDAYIRSIVFSQELVETIFSRATDAKTSEHEVGACLSVLEAFCEEERTKEDMARFINIGQIEVLAKKYPKNECVASAYICMSGTTNTVTKFTGAMYCEIMKHHIDSVYVQKYVSCVLAIVARKRRFIDPFVANGGMKLVERAIHAHKNAIFIVENFKVSLQSINPFYYKGESTSGPLREYARGKIDRHAGLHTMHKQDEVQMRRLVEQYAALDAGDKRRKGKRL